MDQAEETLNGRSLVDLVNPSAVRGESVSAWDFTRARVAVGAGCGVYDLALRQPDGRTLNLLGPVEASALDAEFRASDDPYRSNIFYHAGAAPLFPLANRLRGVEVSPRVLQAEIAGQTVKVAANRKYGPRGQFCHLHGSVFDASATSFQIESDRERSQMTAQFPKLFGGSWVGEGLWSAKLSLSGRIFKYELQFENTGEVPVPVGAGSHPYFKIPSLHFKNIALYIPGRSTVEIDNYANVFPTGKLLPVRPGEPLDFHEPRGTLLNGRYLDNCWTDLSLNDQGCAFAEIFDRESNMKVRVSATEPNAIAIQAYAPAQSSTVAIELVTHLPDPRAEIWHDRPTGMKLVLPGERFQYGYQVEVLPA